MQDLTTPTTRTADISDTPPASKAATAPRRKPIKRAWKRVTNKWRRGAIDNAPQWVRTLFGPTATYLDMLFVDHGIFRLLYLNKHRLGTEAWRAAQPAPHNVATLARRGVRTIVNLRGDRLCGSYWLEQRACARHGITLVNHKMRSRAAPTREEVKAARDLFERIKYPMLMHCKSGADRAGLMSVLYRHFREGVPISEARRELSLRFGHFRQADTGILDAFFDRYVEDSKEEPIDFIEWLDTVYDPEELRRSFHAESWANRLVNQVLRRE